MSSKIPDGLQLFERNRRPNQKGYVRWLKGGRLAVPDTIWQELGGGSMALRFCSHAERAVALRPITDAREELNAVRAKPTSRTVYVEMSGPLALLRADPAPGEADWALREGMLVVWLSGKT